MVSWRCPIVGPDQEKRVRAALHSRLVNELWSKVDSLARKSSLSHNHLYYIEAGPHFTACDLGMRRIHMGYHLS